MSKPDYEQTRMSSTGGFAGLECLKPLEKVVILQKVELLEAIVGIETKNKYVIKDESGQMLFFAKEESNWCARNCLGNMREFNITLHDPEGQEVLTLFRPSQCVPEISVTVYPDNLIGKCKQPMAWLQPKMNVMDENGQILFTVKRVVSCCGTNTTFNIRNLNKEVVGWIKKDYAGFAQEFFTNATNFTINFPVESDVKTKTLLIGACLLVDFIYFERM